MKEAGAVWEQRAARFLQRAGLTLIERNYRCRLGEIDLIMRDGDALVFVEVRYRQRLGFGSGAQSVGPDKQRRLASAARHFLGRYARWSSHPCRFDVVSIEGRLFPSYDWIKDAFQT